MVWRQVKVLLLPTGTLPGAVQSLESREPLSNPCAYHDKLF